MSDRTFTTVGPVSPWTRFGRTAPGIAGSAGVARPDRWSGLPHLAGQSRPAPGAPRRVSLRAMLRGAWRRYRSRQCLVELDAYLLKDIGISYAEAEAEANKPFWVA